GREDLAKPDLRGAPGQRRGDLRVDEFGRQHPREPVDDLEILTAAVQHPRQARPREPRKERAEIESRETIDAPHAILGRDLHETKLREVRALANELGIDRDERRALELLA